jgi:hypothetical protein
MADSNASFIPKNTQRIQKRVRTTRRIYLLSYVSYIVFFGTLIAVAGTYFYAIQVNSSLTTIRNDLTAARQLFSESDIEKIRNLEKRLLVANQLLSELNSPSSIFKDIEQNVAENIQFISFLYEHQPNQKAKLTLEGKAKEFNQVLFQRDLMNRSEIFKNSNIIQFDYALADELEADGSLVNAESDTKNTDATLTFVFGEEISSDKIPFKPNAATAEVVTDTSMVTEIRGTNGTSTDDGVLSDTPVVDNSNEPI